MSKRDSIDVDTEDDLALLRSDNMKIGILEPDGFSKQAINDLKKIGSVELYTGKNFVKFLNNKNILFIRLKYHINDAFKNCKNLQILCSPTTGHTHIDINLLSSKKIKLLSLKNVKLTI